MRAYIKPATSFLPVLFLAIACGTDDGATLSPETSNPIELSIPEISAKPDTDVSSIGQLDLDRYLGTWYEIASIPQWFQAFCVTGVRAQYDLREDGNVSVTNSCYDRDDEYQELVGVAGVSGEQTAELLVTFISDDPEDFGANYWVLYISEAYDLAIVGEPTRETGWILSRSPAIAPETLDNAFGVLANQGYDPDVFELSDQTPYLE